MTTKWKLVHKDTGIEATPGEILTDFRGDTTILGNNLGRPPHKPASQGFVWTTGNGEFYPSVYGLKWMDASHNTYTCICREVDSDSPPEYPDPLIYAVEAEMPDQVILTDLCQDQRRLDADFESELEILFVFEGDLTPVADWRV